MAPAARPGGTTARAKQPFSPPSRSNAGRPCREEAFRLDRGSGSVADERHVGGSAYGRRRATVRCDSVWAA